MKVVVSVELGGRMAGMGVVFTKECHSAAETYEALCATADNKKVMHPDMDEYKSHLLDITSALFHGRLEEWDSMVGTTAKVTEGFEIGGGEG